MVSARFKKRLLCVLFLGIIVAVCFYKIQLNDRDYLTRVPKQTMDFSSVTDREKVEAVWGSHNEDEANNLEEDEFSYYETATRETIEPPTKIHRGLEGNEEVEDTLGWLREHGITPPPDRTDSEVEMTTTDQEGSITPSTSIVPITSPLSTRHETRPLTSDQFTRRDTVANNPPKTSSAPHNSSRESPSPAVPLGSEIIRRIFPVDQIPSITNPSSRSTKPQKQPLTNDRVENRDKVFESTSATKEPPKTSSVLKSELSSNAFVSKHIGIAGKISKSTSSIIALYDSSSKTEGAQAYLSSTVSTEINNEVKSSSASLPTTSVPTPTYTTTPNLRNVDTCKLPKLDPWDPSIRHLLKDVGEDPGCRKEYPAPAFDVIANRLVPTGEVNVDEIDFKHVNVETIHRDDEDDNNVHFIDQGNPFVPPADDIKFSNIINGSDFFKLTYQMKKGTENTLYFARVVPQPDAMRESRLIREEIRQHGKPKGLELNVVMLGFDSVSAASFRRKMPKSLDFLKTSLKTFFFSGQAVIGDATTPALTAMLTGLYETEPPEGRQGFDNSAPVDKWPWLMKLYKDHGYVTMMAEDDPSMGAFNLRLKGFTDPPANHYARPFWLALEQNRERDEPGLCSRSTFMTNYTLDYVLSLFASYPDNLKFAFAFMSYLAHAHPNHLSFADNDLLRVLRTFVKHKHHEDTVIVIFGDHGSRNDDVRNTMQGKLEERLPWLSISVPPWIEEKYPDITTALKHNQEVISSPFDLHATLRHVLSYPLQLRREKTQSLFTKLKHSRTCSEAGIDEHWCPCLEFRDEDVTSPHVIGGAEMVVKYINDVILNRTDLLRTSCSRIELKKILKAESFKPNEKLQRFSSTNQDSDRSVNFHAPTSDSAHYRINFITSPGNAMFEATVAIREDKKVVVNPNISRTNVYGIQPRCILRKYPYARKYCFCKETRT